MIVLDELPIIDTSLLLFISESEFESNNEPYDPLGQLRDVSGLVLDVFSYLCPSYQKPLMKVPEEQVQNQE